MADQSKRNEGDAQFKKAQRAEDGKRATSEYEAEGLALRARTARLKELRLARDAAEAKAPPKVATPAKKKPAKRKKAPSGSLSDWLKDREGSGHNN